jgi:hypothetical protein
MPHQALYKKIFDKPEATGDGRAYLLKQMEQYPYFSLPYFFLLKQSQAETSDDATIASKTALHFNNPSLLYIRLQETESTSPSPSIISTEKRKKEPTETLLFEPLHMTDYFASQGIKLSEEQQATDKLGKQLKSFTEWLKTMKKTHGNTLPENTAIDDSAVQQQAESSNQATEVITESMAEVFVQQGKAQKAIEIYQKLSLQNPGKNVYFAHKIESLKDT